MYSRTRLFLLALLFCSLYSVAQEVVIPFKDSWTFFRGKTQPSSTWKNIDFNDDSWEQGKAPLGYGSSESTYINTIISDMQNSYYSVYFRKEFEVEDVFPVNGLDLKMWYDDGFVVYLNGNRIAYAGLTISNPPFNVTATSHEANPAGPADDITLLSSALSHLKTGTNVLAVQVHNTSLGSSDLFMDLELSVSYDTIPFPCIWEFNCVDKGDGIVAFHWKLPIGAALDTIVVMEGEEIVGEANGDETSLLVSGIEEGEHLYRVFGKKGSSTVECYGGFCELTVSPIMSFVRGDINDDGVINLVDPVYLAHYLFQNGEEPVCQDACDIDDDGALGLGDVILVLDYLFTSGDAPASPGPDECGVDGVLDELPICGSVNCTEEAP